MKLLLLTGLIFTILSTNGQDRLFHLKGKIVDVHSQPIPDAYIINYRDLKNNCQ